MSMATAVNIRLLRAPIPADLQAAGLFEIDLDVLNQIETRAGLVMSEAQGDPPRIGETLSMARALGMAEDAYAESLLRLRAAGQVEFAVVAVPE